MHLISLKDQAIKLRKEGFSYSYISKKMFVAKSTLSLWLRNIEFAHNLQTQEIISSTRSRGIEMKRVDKIMSYQSAALHAEKQMGKISERDMHMLGLGIYIGEGSKTNNFVRVVNSDSKIIRFMIGWLKTSFGLTNSNFKVRIHMYPDNDEREVVKYWKKELKLPLESFHPCYVDKRTNKKRKNRNILSYGTAHLSVVGREGGVLLHRKILASIDRVLE